MVWIFVIFIMIVSFFRVIKFVRVRIGTHQKRKNVQQKEKSGHQDQEKQDTKQMQTHFLVETS